MISGIQETTQADYTGVRTSNRVDNTLGKDAFLKMLIAQLRHQDPLNPMDGTAFVAQLAQFSSLEQLTNLNEAMGALPKYLNQFSNAQMANLIGNEAVVKGNSITVSGSATNIVYRLPAEIQNGTIKIYNANGMQVDTIKLAPQKAGTQSILWNSGSHPPGNYTWEITASDARGGQVVPEQMLYGRIQGVSFKNGNPYLTVNGQEVAFSNVVSITKANN